MSCAVPNIDLFLPQKVWCGQFAEARRFSREIDQNFLQLGAVKENGRGRKILPRIKLIAKSLRDNATLLKRYQKQRIQLKPHVFWRRCPDKRNF